ncbi:Crp/Fnr family transcriptional regulator [Chloroflexota bacterium]
MEKTRLLQKVSLFQDLRNGDLKSVAEIAVEVKYKANQQVFAEGDIGDSVFVVESGAVRVLKKGREGNEEVARLSSGQHFGEMALIDEEHRSATVEAAEDTKLIKIKRADWESLLGQDFPLAYQVYKAFTKHLCRRLRQTTKDLTSMMDLAKELRKFNYFPESW